MMFTQESQERSQGSLLEDIVSALGTVTGDISECPHGLLANIENR